MQKIQRYHKIIFLTQYWVERKKPCKAVFDKIVWKLIFFVQNLFAKVKPKNVFHSTIPTGTVKLLHTWPTYTNIPAVWSRYIKFFPGMPNRQKIPEECF